VTADDARRLALRFGAAVDDATPAERFADGITNEVWRVGDVTVRRYGRTHVTRAALAFEHDVLAHFAARTPLVRAPFADGAGETLVLDGGAFVAVFPFVPGTTGARDAVARIDNAHGLAQVHRAAHDLHVRGGMRSSRTLGQLSWLRERFQRFAVEPQLARVVPWDALILAIAGATVAVAPLLAELPHIVVHGDPHPENIVRDGGVTTGFLDFDFAHETERIYDVAAAADEHARADDDAPLDPAAFRAFVAAYGEGAPLAPAEHRCMAAHLVRRNAVQVWHAIANASERDAASLARAQRYAARCLAVRALTAEGVFDG
jgi:Ser/Thr protein kinase RdoA (MazF antagonist)